MKLLNVERDDRGRPCSPCPHYPYKNIGSMECRGCRSHKKHDRGNTTVVCGFAEGITLMDTIQEEEEQGE